MTTNPYESPETISHGVPRKANWQKIIVQWLVVIAILVVLVALLLPATRLGSREAARRMQCWSNLRNIAVALENYESTYGCLPPAYTTNSDGKPLHSWRTLILPFLDQKALFDRIDLSKPWDDPANRTAHEASLKIFDCPSGTIPKGHTTYFAVIASGGCFQPTEPRLLADIKDDRDRTLMVIEVPDKHAVHWMSPNDASEDLIVNRNAHGKFGHPNGALAVFVSGRVQFLNADIPAEFLRALISIDGGDDALAGADY